MNIVITGASRGMGFAMAEAFASAGHTLYLTSRDETLLNNAIAQLSSAYPHAIIRGLAFDLSQKSQAIAFGQWCLQQATPDVVVNNAGTYKPGNISDEPDGSLESQLAINLYSAYHLTRTLLQAMKQQGSGHIFNICSIASLKAYPGGGAYSISKFALYGFSQNLREELKNFNIKVTSVLPGAVLTSSWGDFDNSDHRIMEARDIAGMVIAATQLSKAACVEDIVVRPQLGDL